MTAIKSLTAGFSILGGGHLLMRTRGAQRVWMRRAMQEQAVSVNLVAPLMRIVTKRSPLRQFVLPVLCDLAHASTKTRAQLWAHSGVAVFLDLLEEDYWGAEAFSSLHVWLVNDRANVESILLRPGSLQKLVSLFLAAQQADFESLLDPLTDHRRGLHQVSRVQRLDVIDRDAGVVERAVRGLRTEALHRAVRELPELDHVRSYDVDVAHLVLLPATLRPA